MLANILENIFSAVSWQQIFANIFSKMSGVGKFLANIFLMLLSLQRLPKVKSFKEMNKKTHKIPKIN